MGIPLSQHKKICKLCGSKFVTNYIRQHFCSKSCSYKNGRQKLKLDKIKNPQKYIDRKKRYHQNRIKRHLAKGKTVLEIVKYNCVICDNMFKPKHAQAKYCSYKCRRIVENKRHRKFKKENQDVIREREKKFYRKNYDRIIKNRIEEK